MPSSGRRSGGGAIATDGHQTDLNAVLASDGELENEIAVHETTSNLSAVRLALINPGGHGDDLPPGPESRYEAMLSLEREQPEATEKTEMDGMISKRGLDAMPPPRGKGSPRH